MRKGRGKGKKQNAIAREDRGSGEEEEKIPANRKRGRPQKPLKDEIKEKEIVKKKEEEEENEDDTNGSVISKEDVTENGRKKKKSMESSVSEEENGLGSKSSTDESMKSTLSIGFRQNGSRRKNKPRRAAESILECNGV